MIIIIDNHWIIIRIITIRTKTIMTYSLEIIFIADE